MSWRNAFDASTISFTKKSDPTIEQQRQRSNQAASNHFIKSDAANYLLRLSSSANNEIDSLVRQIGDRDVIVDACLPPQMAENLRRRNVSAIWVPAVLGDGVSDDEIERQLLLSGNTAREKVLLTRDVKFYRRIRNRAILVSYRTCAKLAANAEPAIRIQSRINLRRQLNKIVSDIQSTDTQAFA
jgi:hypothetical protein